MVRAFVFFLLASGCQWQMRSDVSRERLKAYLPPPLKKPSVDLTNQEPQVIRIRFYADQEFRKQDPAWRTRVPELISNANQHLRAWLAAEFQITEMHDWTRAIEKNDHFQKAMKQLTQRDDAADVDYVIGLFGSLPPEDESKAIGLGQYFGRHLALRNALSKDYGYFFQEMSSLPNEEVDAVFVKFLERIEMQAFLHEWGHVLGIGHTRSADCIMAPAASHTNTLIFCPIEEDLYRRGLENFKTSRTDAAIFDKWVTDVQLTHLENAALFVKNPYEIPPEISARIETWQRTGQAFPEGASLAEPKKMVAELIRDNSKTDALLECSRPPFTMLSPHRAAVDLLFLTDSSGTVIATRPKNNASPWTLREECVAAVVLGWNFPTLGRQPPTVWEHRFVFQTQ